MSAGGGEPVAEHERYMARAVELAERGRGTVAPNPLVGCVVVKDDEVVGEGWHERAGEPHAEVYALRAAGEAARGATLYVTLEPCNHTGRTPPCVDALVKAGVRRVVIAALDPNPQAAGGAKRLQAAGVEVVTGVLEAEANRQNEAFRAKFETEEAEASPNRPAVLYKTAMTLDGKLATRTGQSRWITGARARELVHVWRSEMDAVAVGVNTVLLDDPLLTSRLETGRSPVKVVFDSVARTPPTARLFEPDGTGAAPNVVVYTTEKASEARVQTLKDAGAVVVTLPTRRERVEVGAALQDLKNREVGSLLLEGGGTLAWAFFEAQAVDRVAWFIGPKLLGGGGSSPLGGLGVASMAEAITLLEIQTEKLDDDLLITGRVRYPEVENTDNTPNDAAEVA